MNPRKHPILHSYLPDVRARLPSGGEFISPRVPRYGPVLSLVPLCGPLPFGLAGEPSPLPPAVSGCIVPGYLPDQYFGEAGRGRGGGGGRLVSDV